MKKYRRKYVSYPTLFLIISMFVVGVIVLYLMFFSTTRYKDIDKWVAQMKSNPTSSYIEIGKNQVDYTLKLLGDVKIPGLKFSVLNNDQGTKNNIIVKLDVNYIELENLYYNDYEKYLEVQNYLIENNFLTTDDFDNTNLIIRKVNEYSNN